MSKMALIFIGLIIYVLTGCTPSKKFDFQAAYKFKYIEHSQKDQHVGIRPSSFLVSSEEKSIVPGITPADRRGIINEHIHVNMAAGNLRIRSAGMAERKLVDNEYIPIEKSREIESGRVDTEELLEVKPGQTGFRSGMNESRDIADIEKIQERKAWKDSPPQFKGFVYTAVGFGVVLAGILIGSPQFLSLSLVILGFGIVGFGFMKMLGVF